MKFSHRALFGLLLTAALLLMVGFAAPAAPRATGVGDGTPASCDNNALGAAIAAGGAITFDCGAAPHTILADTYVIAQETVIDGGGLITLDGENLRRIFIVQDNVSLTLRNITLTRGFGTDGAGGAIWNYGVLLIQHSTLSENGTDLVLAGGALANYSPGTVTIEDSVLENNTAADGAAIYSYGPAVTIRNSILRNNAQRENGGFYGGGAILQEVNDDAVITIENSVLQNNHSNPKGAVGGGISLLSGRLVIQHSTLEDNVGYGGGGALYLAAGTTTEIYHSRLSGNRTESSVDYSYTGGAIFNHGTLLVEESVVSGNEATEGGGIYNGGEGSSFTLRRSTVTGNIALGSGGGLLLYPGANLVENSTISGNRAPIGAGIRSHITPGTGTASLRHVTLYGNDGDSLWVEMEPITVRQSILAGPTGGVNCNAGAPILSGGYNLASDASCGFTATGDQQSVEPLLGPLAENGGPAFTHLPAAGSPAIDAAGDDCLAADQRGVARPQGSACDAGAVEVTAGEVTQPEAPFVHADLGGVKPTLTVEPSNGYAGQPFTVQGSGAGAPGVRLAWSQGGQVLTVAEQPVDGQGNYRIQLTVPGGFAPGAAELCATVTGPVMAEYACAPFTVLEPPAANLMGELPAGVANAGNVQVQLLNAAGQSLYNTAVNSAGKFAFAGVQPGFYNYEVVGTPNKYVTGGVLNVATGVNNLFQDSFQISTVLLDPCLIASANTGSFAASPSHETFLSQAAKLYVADIRKYLGGFANRAGQESNLDDVYFGIYMTGVPLNVEFTASPQVLAGQSIARVRFTVLRADSGGMVPLGEDTTAPYNTTYNVGQLPAGQHRIKAEALAADGTTLGVNCKKLVVVSGILPDVFQVAAGEQAQAIQRGFVPNTSKPEKGYYFVRGFVPQTAWPPPPIPNPPPNWPLIGTVENRAGLRMYIDLEMALDGEIRFNVVRNDLYAKLLSTELCNTSTELLKGYTTRFSYIDPNKLYIPLAGGTLCSFYRERQLFRGEIESLWGLISFGVKLQVNFDGSISFNGSLRPMALDIQGYAAGEFNPSLIVDGWVKLFWGVAGGGITPRADIVSFALANINTKANPPYSYIACAAAHVWVNAWARVNYLFGSKTWNLWNKSLLARSTCAQAELLLARAAADDPPPPRVIAAPAIASGENGQMITVYVEDTAPAAPVARAQLMARFRNSDAEPWGDPVALSDGEHMVQDPAVTFYTGGQAIVAWTETVMTPEEDAAATELSQVLRRQEIFYALWDGQQWGAPVRFTTDEAADGSAVLASLGRRVTLAWVRDLDGDLTTRTDWRIATAQLDGENNEWVTAYLLDAAPTVRASSGRQPTTGGMNAEARLVYDDLAVEPTVYAAWTYDDDGELNTGTDRRVIVAHWNVIDEVALNPQPLPPKDWAALNPQPLPPKDWVLLNPQPLPPRVQSPAISFADGNLRLAFLVNEPDAGGAEAPVGLGGNLWVARLLQDGQTWQADPLRDERGDVVIGEAPVFASHGVEQLLLFRRFGDAQSTGALGQLSLSRFDGSSTASNPLYLTNTPQQQWQGALAINQVSGLAQIVKVARIGLRKGQAAAALAPATTQSMMQVRMGVLAAVGDPVETIQVAQGADPALDPLQLSQHAAAPGTPVEVTAVVRNVGRGAAGGLTVNFYAGKPGAGVLQGAVNSPLPLDLNESYAARFTITATAGPGDIYAEVVTVGANLSSANDRAVAVLSKPSAPVLTSFGEDSLFTGNVRLDWLPVPGEAVAGYRIDRSATADGPFEFVGESGQPTYVDLLSRPGVDYCYQVRAYSAASILSVESAPLCGKLNTTQIGGQGLYLPLVTR